MRSLGLELLPDEALGRIFGFLDDKAQHCFIRVSKALNTIKDHAKWRPHLWDAFQLAKLVELQRPQPPSESQLIEGLMPVCRWLAHRAATSSLERLTFTVTHCSQDKDCNEGCAECDRLMYISVKFLAILMGCMRAADANLPLQITFGEAHKDCYFSETATSAAFGLFKDADMISELARRLVVLELSNLSEPVSAQHWRSICQLQSLRALNVDAWQYDLGGIPSFTEEISQLTNLVDLRAYWCNEGGTALQTSDGLRHLTLLTKLHMLSAVTGSCFGHISGVTSLIKLLVKFPEGPLAIPRSLSGLQSLRKLSLEGVTLAGEVQAIGDLAELQHLDGTDLDFEQSSVAACFGNGLSKLIGVTFLHLSFVNRYSMDSCNLHPLSKLVQLYLYDITLTNFQPSAHWPALERLRLFWNGLSEVPNLAGLRSLQQCSLRQEEGFQVKQPLAYVTTLPRLELLELKKEGQTQWSVQSLVHLADAMYRGAGSLSRKPALVIRA